MRRLLCALLLMTLVAFTLPAMAETPAEPRGRILYFADVGAAAESVKLSVLGLHINESGTYVSESIPLVPGVEYWPAAAPYGLIAFDVAPDVWRFPYGYLIDFSRVYLESPGSGYHYLDASVAEEYPERLYAVTIQTKNLPDDTFRAVSSQASRAEDPTNLKLMMSLVRSPADSPRKSITNEDRITLVSGDTMLVFYDAWTAAAAGQPSNALFIEADISDLVIGESVEMPLLGGDQSKSATATVTKVALLRDKPSQIADAEVTVPAGEKIANADEQPAEGPRTVIGRLVVKASSANIRESGDANSPAIDNVGKGAAFDVVGVSDTGWYEVLLKDGSTGFIAPKMVRYSEN